jgi:hypothetical protein
MRIATRIPTMYNCENMVFIKNDKGGTGFMRRLCRAGIATLVCCAFLLWTLSAGVGVALAAKKPVVYAYSADVRDDYVSLGAEIDDDGGTKITEYGFYYS